MTNQYFEMLKTGAIILGVVVVLLAILYIFLAVRRRKPEKKGNKLFNFSATAVAALCVAIILVASWATDVYASAIDAVMTVSTASEETTDTDDWKELAYTIAEEGMVLMKNDDDALPLASGTKVNLLGYYAYNPLYSGSGSGSVSASDSVSIVSSLEAAGIEINPALEESGIYATSDDDSSSESVGFVTAEFSLDEVSIDSYTGDVSFENLAAYSDTAIIVIGRSGGEGDDLTGYTEGDYLVLNEDEEALLSAAQENFETVIVVINSANAIEMGWVNDYDVDAVVWAALPGPYGFEALGQILTGAVNPSGKLPDTWVYDNDSNPVNENFGEQEADNAEGRYYVDYVEGIYVGYKWYETAYAEQAVITNTETGETFDYSDYDSIVAYPFGYGLSYTTFDQEITGGTLTDGTALDATDTYTVEVTVTNTGDVAGKSVVQLYVTVPYTDYDKENLVEKSEVSLVVYGKTEELEPGTSEVITLEVSMEAIASYDSSYDNGDGTGGSYMLDAGDYTFSIRSDAHTVLDSVTATLEDQYFFSGDDKRSSDETAAINQFDDAARGEYLSRQDGFANYESAMNSVSTSIENLDYAITDDLYDEALDDVVTEALVEGVDYAVDGDLTLADMTGLDYDDPLWDELISQLTVDEMLSLTGYTLYSSAAVESIDKDATTDSDGPLGISSMFNTDLITVAFPCVPLLSATFNTDLAYEMGSCVADQAEANSITSWYAPAMDTHRSAYSGRNFEYYSEDSTLSAYTAVAEVSGARDKGLIVYIKHFALNDQETHRAYVHTYSNEQAIREIYLKPFEYAVKEGGATGVMTSMNYIGDTYAGGHLNLITNVLRGEWGFQGTVLTDMDEGGEIRSYWATLRAGADVWLGFNETSISASSDADIYYLQRACHNHLYVLANGNSYSAEILDWQSYRTIIYVELGVLAAACVVSLVLRNMKKKEKDAQ
ncbi:MAG: glycoside hydrolase family 3 C-terminal domain-containing protein [Clostridiales bacterium]|nr:glycoside hydrolase family 3 C-terminal domain-containing protein [Clostridiales bacterium]